MNRNDVDWKGIMIAVPTPFNSDESIDSAGFCEMLENEIKSGVNGVVVAGNTGESWALDDGEKRYLYELAMKQVHGRVPVLGGTDAMRVSETIGLAKHAAEMGLDGIMVLPPPCSLPKPHEIIAFYESISRAAKIPILLHNDASRVVVNMLPETVHRLADVDTVVAIKEGCPDVMQELETIRLCRDKIRVMCGWPGRRALWSFVMGSDGSVGGADIVLGREAYGLWDLVQAREMDKAARVQARLQAVMKGLAAAGTFQAALKEALRLTGRPGGHVRRPLLPLDANGTQKVKELMTELGLV